LTVSTADHWSEWLLGRRDGGKLDQSRFLLARAEDLAGIPDASVDVATCRSVLIYVADKQRAFDELHRVLAPGGRISLFEPINRLMFPEPEDRFWGYDVAAVTDLADRVKDTFAQLEHADAASMMDFDERDLFAMARRAGFAPIHLELHTDLIPGRAGMEARPPGSRRCSGAHRTHWRRRCAKPSGKL